jgi:tRNA-dihydrouridine synthase
MSAQMATGLPLHRITRHMLGLFHAQPGGRIWRQILSSEANKPGAGLEVVQKALAAVEFHCTQISTKMSDAGITRASLSVAGYPAAS